MDAGAHRLGIFVREEASVVLSPSGDYYRAAGLLAVHHTPADRIMTRLTDKVVLYASVAVALVLLAAACSSSDDKGLDSAGLSPQSAGSSGSIAEVRSVLDAQVAAWNRGSIRAFMEGYARTDSLRFASGGTVWRGWDGTFERYRDAYGEEDLMGTLTFTDLDIWPLSEQHAVAFGRWALDRSEDRGDVGGLFTLLFENGPNGWKIVHDHTSASAQSQQQDSVDTTS